jgi:glycosyltransferase involved in cell wall biosynthesis
MTQSPKLSIVIPAYNESATILRIVDKVMLVKLLNDIEKEIIVINDFSIDNTLELINTYREKNPGYPIHVVSHNTNLGKGASIRTGIKLATGSFIIIQDADMEYDPDEYNLLLKPMVDGFADVVYGSRFVGGRPHRILFFWHSIGNKALTFLSNMLTNFNLTDIETGYKLFRADILKSIILEEDRFGFEPEVTAKISKIKGIRLYEVGISYYGRTYAEGKKINWKDGFDAIFCILKYTLFK